MLCNFHFIWVFSMKIIKKLILAETWLLCLRNLCWALQKVDKHETLEAWESECWFPGWDFPHFVIPRNFTTISFTLASRNSRTFSIRTNFISPWFFSSFVYTKKKILKRRRLREGRRRRKPETFNVTLQKMPENFISLQPSRQGKAGTMGEIFSSLATSNSRAKGTQQKKSNKHIMAFIAMYTYTWKVFVCFHPDKRFIFPLPRPFASPLQFHSRYCLCHGLCVVVDVPKQRRKIINTENGKHSVCRVKKREFFHKKTFIINEKFWGTRHWRWRFSRHRGLRQFSFLFHISDKNLLRQIIPSLVLAFTHSERGCINSIINVTVVHIPENRKKWEKWNARQ